MTDLVDPPVRCSAWARSVGLAPIATIGVNAGFAVVDWPLPWPVDMGDVDALGGFLAVARDAGLRVQARVPTYVGEPTVTLYRPVPGPGFSRYAGRSLEVALASGTGAQQALVDLLAAPAEGDDEAGEILICTHGRRDTCCGSVGTSLFSQLQPDEFDRPLRRTSHTGGHRFAPTAIVLPQGTAWAFTDAHLLRAVTRRSGHPAEVVDRYRGCAGLGSRAVQAVEGAVLARTGWSLLDSARIGHQDGSTVRLEVVAPDGAARTWQAEVVAGRQLSVPDCGRPLSEAWKSETEQVVENLIEVVA